MKFERLTAAAPGNAPPARVVRASHVPSTVLIPLALVSTIFAVMGFVGGVGEVMNKLFQDVLDLSKTESTGLQVSFFSAYIVGPLTASGWLLRKYGYRTSIVTGFTILGAGCLLFWPSAHFASFGGFCGSKFLIGSGFALLDCAAIPYMCNLGSSKGSEMRVNISLSIQSAFSVGALMLASYVILEPVRGMPDISARDALAPVQWVFVGVASFCFLMAIVCRFGPLPEIEDSVLTEQMEMGKHESGWVDKPLRKQVTLWCGFVACFCFIGAQIGIGAFFINFATEAKPSLGAPAAARMLAILHGAFAVVRFALSMLMKWIRPRLILLVSMALTLIFLAAAIGVTGQAGLILMICEIMSKACVFPTMLSLSLRGLGRHTKQGSAILVSSISAGMVFAPAMGAAADRLNTRLGLCVPLGGVVIAFLFPIYLNTVKAKELDALRSSGLVVKPAEPKSREDSTATDGTEDAEIESSDERMPDGINEKKERN